MWYSDRNVGCRSNDKRKRDREREKERERKRERERERGREGGKGEDDFVPGCGLSCATYLPSM